jgi:hypothetical protein
LAAGQAVIMMRAVALIGGAYLRTWAGISNVEVRKAMWKSIVLILTHACQATTGRCFALGPTFTASRLLCMSVLLAVQSVCLILCPCGHAACTGCFATPILVAWRLKKLKKKLKEIMHLPALQRLHCVWMMMTDLLLAQPWRCQWTGATLGSTVLWQRCLN